ncbi:ammonia-dependent NAD(+) synthetase [Vagococcus zengguangii]|uniref:NH(3)-dependent NAD(+) synthetase n=1 Tax=Vagococcus zengguangii TaxID=2571750 RepID=A0A4D7CSA0_9ENTE|nr:ammonia-dependent NAD(+) synthetase [Vagococcus zengguangii]QCI87135.1 ammonia-dependent NAD(+) synthetase [Vagococcus zengguangii]TLG80639.1 ammonia-dependent NAD(+) synthetase [Vagococcus zengguangii]
MNAIQQEIIQALEVESQIDAQQEIRRRINFLKEYLLAHPFLDSYVLGISGGQDSTLAGRLAQMAINELREETGKTTYQFIAVRLPYGVQADEDDCQEALAFIQPDKTMTVNIKDSVDQLEAQFESQGFDISDFNKGNIKARLRMTSQYAIAGQTNGAVIGTDHAAEAVTGFYTKFGDGAADLMPLFGLNKRQGRALLKELQAPTSLYEKVPTADLEDDKPQIPDEVALGVTYEAIDDYLEGKAVTPEASARIEQLYQNSEHKRHLPITIYDTFWKK